MVRISSKPSSIAYILDAIDQPLVVFRRTRIIATNTRFAQWLGYSSSDDVPQHLWQILHPSSQYDALDLYFYPEQHINNQFHFMSRDKQLFSATVAIKPLSMIDSHTRMATIKPLTETYDIISPDSLPVGIYRRGADGTILYANRALANIFGFDSVREFRQNNIKDFFTVETPRGENLEPTDKAHLDQNEYPMRRTNGDILWLRDNGRTILTPDGEVDYTYGSIEDITLERQRTEELSRRNKQLQTLNSISAQLSSVADLKTILREILVLSRQSIPYDSASVFLSDGVYLVPEVTQGIPTHVNIEELTFKLSESFLALQAGSINNVHYLPDVTIVDEWTQLTGMEHIRSWIGVPVWYQDDLIGLVNFDHREIDFFNDEHQQFALDLSRQIAVAIHDARLYEKAQKDLQERLKANDQLIKTLIQKQTLYWILDNLVRADVLTDDILNITLNMLIAAQDHIALLLIIFDKDSSTLMHHIQTGEIDFDGWMLFCELTGLGRLPYSAMPLTPLDWQSSTYHEWHDEQKVFAAPIDGYGVLAAIQDVSKPSPDENERELIITIANQLTIVVQKQLLSAELRRKNAQLEQAVDARTRALKLEQERTQAILDATAEGIFYMEDYRLQYANSAFCHMVGYSLQELRNKPLSFILSNDDEGEDTSSTNLFRALTTGNELEFGNSRDETRLQHKDGTEFFVEIRYSILGNLGDDQQRLVGIARDISQERELTFQRAQFITNAAHELRNPLSSLGLRIHLLKKNPSKAAESIDSLQFMYNHLVSIVEEFSDLSRFERGHISLHRNQLSFQEVMTQAFENQKLFAEQQGITVTLDMPDENIPIYADGKRLLQLLDTIIVNGINYNEPDGHVNIKVALTHDSFNEDAIMIWVKDDGLGISRDLLPSRIFEPFSRYSQGSRKETGMGLALAREIVRLHGGTIHAQSDGEGMGTTMRVMLPLNLNF